MGYPDASSTDTGMPAFFGVFLVLFLLALFFSIVIAVIRFNGTREMAKRKGATDSEALTLGLGGDVALAAAYLKPPRRLTANTM